MIKRGLGKGLGALISSVEDYENGIQEIRLNEIEPNMEQPRRKFDDEKLSRLAESIKQHGVVQPIIVRKENNIYRIVAGERRWRAARIAGLSTIPVIIKELTNKQLMEIALIENLQREDLNPIEEAEAYEKLIKEYNMTQEEISKIVGKSRSAIANSLRLLSLNDKTKQYVVNNYLSSGHARALVVIEDIDLQTKVADEIINKNLNVRETEKIVKRYLSKKPAKGENIYNEQYNEQYIEIEDKFKKVFGTKVKILSKDNKGKIIIEYYSNEDLDRIIELVDFIETERIINRND